ncbi:hypothetical protein [Streptomyces sp. NBC_01262]|uniref:hypothetical protein n=2 Tax=Streptomyces sp. NBC_01262 TaxID=2903803 RepID=UPI002E336CBC|nr:hypothetical protein [Streptomyces sp. NBC_01262]
MKLSTNSTHVRFSLWYVSRLSLPIAGFLLLRGILSSDGFDRDVFLGGVLAVGIVTLLLWRLVEIVVTNDSVTVRRGVRTTSISVVGLVSVSAAQGSEKSSRTWELVLEGSTGERERLPLVLVAQADRRRLLTSIEALVPPGVVRRDAVMRRLLGEEN